MKPETKDKQFSIRLDKKTYDEIKALAIADNRKFADYVTIYLRKLAADQKAKPKKS